MRLDRYFDNAATSPLDPRVLEAMLPYLKEDFGNAHSLHSFGGRAMAAVDEAREQVASLLNVQADEIVFTSGATEANNWMLAQFPDLAVSPFEHSSLYEPAKAAFHTVLPNRDLCVEVADGQKAVSLMKVNNEIGTVFSPETLARPGRIIHSDITQALGKVPVSATKLDFASFSAHKFYGPKGIGGLYAKNAFFPEAWIQGGNQENGLRAGTLNVPAIVGMGRAALIAEDEWEQNALFVRELRSIVFESLDKKLDFQINGGDEVSPYILSVSFYGIEGETLVVEMDRMGFAISSGAACSSGSVEPSHVLTALKMDPQVLRGTIRISFGGNNTKEATQELAKALNDGVETINSLNV